EDAAEPVTVDLNVAGTQFVSAGQWLDILISIENLLGSAFNDTLTGNGQANRLSGGGGNDSLTGGGGVDTLDGGNGFDVANYSLAATGVVAELWRSFALNDGDGAQDSLLNLEGLTGSSHNDLLAGSDGNELFNGGAGNDGLYAAGGLDTLIGGAGNDTLDGGAGIDIAHYGAATGPVTAELWRSYALNDGQGGQDALWNIEGLTGSAFNDLLAGGAANDILIGSGGNDGLYAAAGNDTLVGGTGNDTMDGGPGIDIADYGGASGPVTAELWRSYALNDGQGGQDALWNIEGVLGSPFSDLLAGGANNEVLVGGAGNDGLYGAGGIDTLMGGAGNDTMDGGPGIDAVEYGAATGPVTAELWRSFATNDGQGGQDALWNVEFLLGSGFNDLLAGTTGDNYLDGRGGADQLFAAAGNDTLVGGPGNDTLNGGAGLDVFLFNAALGAGNIDIVQDFAVVDDTVWLENAVFTALVANGPLGAGQLRAGAGVSTAADGDDFILYNSSTGALYYDADGSGVGAAPVQFALLGAGLGLTVADLVAV
ncbi:MAG: calcium-binding protein, partial [Rhodoferax sp.]|nr:calcium-binding protein [Rhodoferax sp.]